MPNKLVDEQIKALNIESQIDGFRPTQPTWPTHRQKNYQMNEDTHQNSKN